ncbi:LOW QUALITY PROTEIN: jerky protein homolog-like [Rhagoletis pomonella]|uniref:LOW QUALITY PROTEIN: jerky protein homolog-like n=1 Tax=Rhagoletis pomonella TaxID=28610 RepID=UPI00177B1E3B|nr:LOW QUALITY PROTEIN: jerky protein homolog-like [Rhagoletis pomonella]
MEELGLSREQLCNADESGLFWKLLPQKTYVSSLEKMAPGAKMEKQRVAFLCCSNATGSHQLKLLVVGHSRKPRCFKGFDCSVHYRHSKSAWMTGAIFKDWFHRSFIPEVTKFLTQKGLPVEAIVLIDNAPSYPPENELKSKDGSILTMFMPPNENPPNNPWIKTQLGLRNFITETVFWLPLLQRGVIC